MIKEYGIACLLSEASIAQLKQSIPYLEKMNIPHISLFQFNGKDTRFLTLVQQVLPNLIRINTQFTTLNIAAVDNNMFLDIMDDGSLKQASDTLAHLYLVSCKEKAPLSQINFSQLSFHQTELVKRYGIYWIKENFRPHVTLTYQACYQTDIALPISITISSPQLYEIDHLGRIQYSTNQSIDWLVIQTNAKRLSNRPR